MRRLYPVLLAAFFLAAPGAAQQPDQEPPAAEDEPQRTPLEEYEFLLRQIEYLGIYNGLLERQIANQEREVQQIRGSMDQIPEIERQVPALLMNMVEALEQFIALDIPFHIGERTDRVAELKGLLERGDVNDAEKFRRVMEAWLVENDYGTGVSAYTGELSINGTPREVSFLQLGRVALIYQTPDGEFTGVWDQRTRDWAPLGTTHRNSVRQALRVARQQVAPELVLLPVPAPEG